MLEINNTTKNRLKQARLHFLAEHFFKYFKKKLNVSLAIVGDTAMQRLNKRYRGKDKPTDILSFPELNELIIDYAQIKRQAKEFGHSTQKELEFIFVHGLLHLLGYEDDNEKKRLKMIALGEDFLRKI